MYGLEVSVENEDKGGIASAFQFLEIAHTHYHGRDIKEQIARLRDDDEMSVISNSDSTISNLSDHSRDMSAVHSWVAETGQFMLFLNPLSPNISMHFLLTVLHIFLMVVAGRMCIKIKSSCL